MNYDIEIRVKVKCDACNGTGLIYSTDTKISTYCPNCNGIGQQKVWLPLNSESQNENVQNLIEAINMMLP